MKKVKIGERKVWENKISQKDFVLDVGCWDGSKVKELSKKSNYVYGLEIDKSKLEYADPDIKKKLKLGDITKNVSFNKKFDWIIFGEVLEHLDQDKKAIKNISKLLKRGGKLILTTPNSVRFFEIWDPAWFRWKFLGGQRHYHYAQNELFGKLNDENLEVKEYYVTGDFMWVFFRWFNVVLNYILRINKKILPFDEKDGFCDWVILAEKK